MLSLFERLRHNLRARLTLGVVLPLVLILGAFTAIEYARHRQAVLTNLSFLASQTGQVIENSLRHEMRARNLNGLQHMLDAIGSTGAIRVVYLLDTSGRVVFAPEGQNVGSRLDNSGPACQPCHARPAAERPGSVVVTLPGGERIFRSMTPIVNQPDCQACHDPSQRLNGLLLTDISMAPLEAPLAQDLREIVLWSASTILVSVLVVNLVMSRMVMRRLEVIARTLARFGRGQPHLRLPAEPPDEIGQLTGAFNQMGQRIEAEEAENRALSRAVRQEAARRYELLKRLISAQEEERRRVARDLHDDLGQQLSGLALSLQAIERLWQEQPAQARSQLERAQGLVAETTERAYAMILALRPSILDDLGLAPALRALAERALKDSPTRFELQAAGLSRRLPPEIETALFRTYQEALTNVARHAGAGQVSLTLAVHNGNFEGEITDDGCGFDLQEVQHLMEEHVDRTGSSPRGLGLLGMQERIAQCGGTLEILSRPGAGARLLIRLPLPETNDG